MKKTNAFLSAMLMMSLFACQLANEDLLFNEISDIEVSSDDTNRKLSHSPTGVEYVKIASKSIQIDFRLHEYAAENINYPLDEIDNIDTVGELISACKAYRPHFQLGWSSIAFPPQDGNYVLSRFAYRLAQECFQKNCSAQTRRAVLQLAIEKQKQLFNRDYLINFTAVRSINFLISIILIRENDADFLAAIQKNKDMQTALSMNTNDSRVDKKFSDFVTQFGIKYLLNSK